MHPLARIDPSIRTAFVAFVVARSALWLGLNAANRLTWTTPTTGTPLFTTLTDVVASPWFIAALGELLLFAGVVAVYRFARRDGMPQTADRATWLWIASPAMVFATPGSDFTFAFAFVALAMGAILRPVWSAIALSAAVALRPEAIVVWPALAWAWWAYRDGDPLDRLVLAVLPAAAFAVTVLAGVFVGEPAALFAGSTGWRSDLVWHGFWQHSTDLLIGGLLLSALAITLRMGDETPRGWFWATVPVVLLVAAHEPMFAGLAVLPFAVPFYVQLAKFAHEVDFERILLSASLVGLTLLAAT